MEKHDLPLLNYTISQFLRAANISRATFYKLPPEERPPFRKFAGKSVITADDAERYMRSLPLATWDEKRGINKSRSNETT